MGKIPLVENFDDLTIRDMKEILHSLQKNRNQAQKLLKEKTTRAKDVANTLEKTAPEQIDYTIYLTHAPAEARDFFESESMTSEHQADAMQHIEYLPDSISLKDENWYVIAELDNQDLTAPDKLDEEWNELIKTVNSVTYFQRDEMMDYTKENNIEIPTDALYEQMLSVMPAGDYTKKHTRCQAGLQLHRLLWGSLSGSRSDGEADIVGVYGYFWSSSGGGAGGAFALGSLEDKATLDDFPRGSLFPVRALRTA